MKKILIVDDSVINRNILKKILIDRYQILEAENGQAALEVLRQHKGKVALMLLDIVMPVMNGYQVLAAVRDDPMLAAVPIIVTTGSSTAQDEIRCLSEGASDFVTKPFNAEIVRHRVESIIRLQEKSALLTQLEFDQLTGVYSKEFFYQDVADLLDSETDQEFDLVCCDVENFKIINEKYGAETGDQLLVGLAEGLKGFEGSAGLCGRLAANTFALVVRHREDYTQEFFAQINEQIAMAFTIPNIVLKFGVYEISDRSLPVTAMCDRAMLALQNVKHKYGLFYAPYSDTIRQKMLQEQQIVECMDQALSERQFSFYLQPKHDVQTGDVSGAEALVRWTHPEFGFMSPGSFIPLFERNGFITKLDSFIWEEICRYQKSWIDQGLEPVPISVNISRVDFEALELPRYMAELIARYDVPAEILHLEVTETAYADNPQKIIQAVESLRSIGFVIEMDDFGSGYSSLNMLSDLPVDIIKLDMQFMKRHEHSANNRSIISFILSLSKWLGLPTIAEGVENLEELTLLTSMGCNFVQGYYFSKPMPSELFLDYVKRIRAGLSLPVDTQTDAAPSYSTAESRRTVLVVEDIVISQQLLKEMLTPQYDVLTAGNGVEALECLREESDRVAVVMLDLMMPVMDGFQLMKQIQQDPELSRIPVIITSEAGADSDVRALRLGAENFLAKPYKKEILLHHIQSAIDRAELRELKKQLEQERDELANAVYRDDLTGLLNRRGLNAAAQALPKAQRHGVLLLNLEPSQPLSAPSNPMENTRVLHTAVSLLQESTRRQDLLAQLDNREFVAILENLSNEEVLKRKAQELCDKLNAPSAGAHPLCSVGATFLDQDETAEEVCFRVNKALTQAQKNKEGGFIYV